MAHEAKYAVKFIGYAAFVVTRKKAQELTCARLDFVSGSVMLYADKGCLIVHHRDAIDVVRQLPRIVGKLENVLHKLSLSLTGRVHEGAYSASIVPAQDGAGSIISITVAPGCDIHLCLGANLRKTVLALRKRLTDEFEQLLNQAEVIGTRIERRPYSEYIDELGRTGSARVEAHGYGLFVAGQLIFHPTKHTTVVTPTEVKGQFAIKMVDPSGRGHKH